MQEIWLAIAGYEGLYEVSNFGNIKTLRFTNTQGINERSKDRIMKQQTDKFNYKTIGLRDSKGVKKRYFVHRLVSIAHVPNPLNLPEINHYDADKANNKAINLMWSSGRDNLKHYYDGIGRNVAIGYKINKVDADGKVINTYDTIRQAAEANNILPINLGKMLRGEYKRNFKSEYVYAMG